MAHFRASVDKDQFLTSTRGSASANAAASATASSFVARVKDDTIEATRQPENQSFLPRSFEKKRAILSRPDEEGLFEGDLLRQYPRREKTGRDRPPTGNTVKIEFLPRCLNLIQLKDILDFAGQRAIVKIRDEATAISVISFLDGCVLR